MLAEWNAECAQDAPTLMVPWTDETGGSRFVDLRTNPYDIAEISEIERWDVRCAHSMLRARQC